MRARRWRLWLGASVLFAGAGWADHGDGSDLLRIHFIDVGHGDAIWIQTPADEAGRGLNIIIDGGPDSGNKNRLLTYLAAYRLKPGAVIDYLIVTHPHDDHYPGAIDVLKHYDVLNILESGYSEYADKFKKFLEKATTERVQGRPANFVKLRDQPLTTLPWGEIEARILHSDRADLTGMGSKSTRQNNASTVLRLAYGRYSYLLMGDAEGKDRDQPAETARYVEGLLLSQLGPAGLGSTVLKAAHHGSETGSTLPFLRAVAPEVVVVMAGRKEFNGKYLPDASVLARYPQVRPGVAVLRTDQGDERLKADQDADGDDVLMYSDGEYLQVYQAVGSAGRRRWKQVKSLP